MSQQNFDLLVIGGGPGGYTAAIAGAQSGLKAALVESRVIGGTCLNRGCVPTKTLLHDTRFLNLVRSSPFLSGEMRVDLKNIDGRKDMVVQGSRTWLESLFKGNGVNLFEGRASFTGPKTVQVLKADQTSLMIEAGRVVIATGASDAYPPNLTPDGRGILNTEDALRVDQPPARLAVIGGGARGVELAQIYRNLGSRVVIFEKERRLLPRFDRPLTGRYRKSLTEAGIRVMNRTEVLSAVSNDNGRAVIEYQDKNGAHSAVADKAVLALPRRPDFSGLNLEAAGLSPADGLVECGPGHETAIPGLYIVGDAAGPPFWAHKAIAQGLAAVRHMTGQDQDGRPRYIPSCVYGDPEVAGVGLTEDEAKAAGRKFKLGEFHYIGNGRAGTLGESQGLVRLLADAGTNEVLGVHILGAGATELISLASLAMENGVDVEGVKKTVFVHPTLAENFFEAALAADGRPIHLLLEGLQND